jgi:hypothetical protein
MVTKIKRLAIVVLAALLLAGSGLVALPANEVLAGNNTSDPSCDPPIGR